MLIYLRQSTYIHTHPAIPHIPLSNTVGTSADAVYLLSRGSKPLGVTSILHICLRQTASLISKLLPVLKLLIPTLELVHLRASAALTDASHKARLFHTMQLTTFATTQKKVTRSARDLPRSLTNHYPELLVDLDLTSCLSKFCQGAYVN